MAGENQLDKLLGAMNPILNDGEYVFVTVQQLNEIDRNITICEFKEKEGITLVIEKKVADELKYSYDFVASWITLMIHSSLEAIGLTAMFSNELANNGISCNVIAGYYHDHIFVDKKDSRKAMQVLRQLSERYK